MNLHAYFFGADPLSEFGANGLLEGFDPEAVCEADYDRVAESTNLSEEETLGMLPDGRLAVVGMTVQGHLFWIEEE